MVFIGILILVSGFILKKSEVKLTALGVFIFSALASLVAFSTGEGAEEVIEHINGISETLIHKHEELGESFLILTLILGFVALLAIFTELKKMKFSYVLMMIIFVLAISDGILASFVGNSRGEIRHTEIRNNTHIIQLDKGGG